MSNGGAEKIGLAAESKPRVHPAMVVFTFGARKKQELPFVIGVMADLSMKPMSKPKDPGPGATPEQKENYENETKKYQTYLKTKLNFLDIDSGNLNARMEAMKPTLSYMVPNLMSREGGDLPVKMEFKSMDDFKPERVAMNNEACEKVLAQIQSLQNLKNYLDGKNAEDEFNELLKKIEEVKKPSQ